MSRPLLLPLLLFIVFNFTRPSAVLTEIVHRCDNVKIKHPFWESQQEPNSSTDTSPSYCGPPFKVTCDENGKAISSFADNYTIRSIDYDRRTLTVVNAIALEKSTADCPKLHANVCITRFPGLNYASDVVNLTFFYDCNKSRLGPLRSTIKKHRITCPLDGKNGNSTHDSYVFSDKEQIKNKSLYVLCDSVVVAPVGKRAFEQRNNVTGSPGKALRQGFSLRWAENVSAHRDCERKRAGKVNVKRKAIVAACSLCLGFVLASVCFAAWLRFQKRRRQISSPTKSPRSTSFLVGPDSIDVHNYHTHIFSYDELKDATDGFAAVNELGNGGFGTVYKGELDDGQVVAVKRLYENNYNRVEQFMNEVSILSLLRHKNLVTLYGCTSRHSRELLLVYEFVPNGTVSDHLRGFRADERALTWPIRLKIAVETAGALAYLHAVVPQIIHRDVKTDNILLDDNFGVKVADLGLCRWSLSEASHVSTAPQGTPGYVDPEYHWSHKLTDKSDVYSFGVVLMELISSMPPIDIGRHEHEICLANMAVNKIQSGLLEDLVDKTLGFGSDEKVSMMVNSVAEVAFRCLQAEKEMRPTMEEVLHTLEQVANREQDKC